MDPNRQRPLVTCPKGLEGLLADELVGFGAGNPRETPGGVYVDADLRTLYRICLWSRLASRVLPWLATFDAPDADTLYDGVRGISWDAHLAAGGTLAVAFHGSSGSIRHSHFGALRVKDAIVDQFMERHGERPSVDTAAPDLRVHARLRRGELTLRIDIAGEALHRRGYRRAGGKAPLKENLAAAVLLRAGWPAIAARGGALIDPMCGSGTLLIEGAWMALDRAPGLARGRWGFDGWLGHVPGTWQALVDEARRRRDDAARHPPPDCFGYDSDPGAIAAAEANIDAAGLAGIVRVRRKELARFAPPTHKTLTPGLVVTNAPYGERLGDEASVAPLYRALGDRLKREFDGWDAAVLTGNPALGKRMGLRSRRQYALLNGSIESRLLTFEVNAGAHVRGARDPNAPLDAADEVPRVALSPGAQMFANRLRKNLKALSRWRRREGVSCFRAYDADMPEYAVAVDVYDGHVHVAEYQAPATVEPAQTQTRLRDVQAGAAEVFGIAPEAIAIKQRVRQRGTRQYGRQAATGEVLEVTEGPARLLVNLRDYLDTGLFMDHRKVRAHIGASARGRRFLNLYCYTGAATVHAALGGARLTTSVDLSRTYLDWAGRNLALNGFGQQRHALVQADVSAWLAQAQGQWDLILVDPPTWSNSKRTDADFDVQRDHAVLLGRAMRHLSADGLLIFSNNRRRFTLDPSVTQAFDVEDRTRWSTDRDFERARLTRYCWFVRHRGSAPSVI